MTFSDANHISNTDRQSPVSLRELAIATAAALVVFFAAIQFIVQATSPIQPVAMEKSDRLPLAGIRMCAAQAWGAWSEACLAQIAEASGNESRNLRQIPTETVEIRDASQSLSILTHRTTDG